MSDTPEIARLRAALAEGPTPGDWKFEPLYAPKSTPLISAQIDGRDTLICCIEFSRGGPILHADAVENAAYIAACNPAAMASVLAHIDAQAAEIDRLRTEIDAAMKEPK